MVSISSGFSLLIQVMSILRLRLDAAKWVALAFQQSDRDFS